MATYSLAQVTFSAAQEVGLDYKLFQVNAARAAQSPPLTAWTKQQLLDSYTAGWPAQFVAEVRNDFTQRAGVAMQTTSLANLQSVATTLGIDANPYD